MNLFDVSEFIYVFMAIYDTLLMDTIIERVIVMFDMFLTTLPATIGTIGIILTLILVFVLHRYFIELNKENIKSRSIVLLYGLLFVMIALAIVGILTLWGYDVTDFISSIFVGAEDIIEASVSRIVGTLITIFVALVVFKIGRIALYKLGSSTGSNQRRKNTIAKITLSILKYIVVIVALLAVLSVWGVNVAPALAGLGILGLVIGLGAQKFINDLISGFFIVFEHHFDVGDWIEINGFMGEVIDIGLKTTKVKNFKGEIRIFNNGSIDPVSNFSRTESLAVVEFGISYKEDIAKTIAVLQEALPKMKDEFDNMVEAPRILGVTDLASSSVNIRAVVKVQSMTQWGVERALRQRIKEILVENNIEIPFPQVVVHNAQKS